MKRLKTRRTSRSAGFFVISRGLWPIYLGLLKSRSGDPIWLKLLVSQGFAVEPGCDPEGLETLKPRN